MDNFAKYSDICSKGASPQAICSVAIADGLNFTACIRLIRQLFDMSLVQAKEVYVVASGQANSLMEYQEGLVAGLTEAFETLHHEDE